MNYMEINRPPVEMMRAALYLTGGRIDKAQRLLADTGYTCTRLGFYRRMTTKGLNEYARELRKQNKKVIDYDNPNRCRWAFGKGCNEDKASTRVDFCPKHQERHNAHIAKQTADRNRREVCITCERTLAPTSKNHCERHLETANKTSYRNRAKRANAK